MSILSRIVGWVSPVAERDAGTSHFAVMSPLSPFSDERKTLIRLFEAGLSAYHLRRKQWNLSQYKKWILGVPAEFRSKIVLHQFPQLVRSCGLGGFHCEGGAGEAELAFAGTPQAFSGAGEISARSEDYPTLCAVAKKCRRVLLGPVFPPEKYDITVPRRTVGEYAAIIAYWRKHGGRGSVLAYGGVRAENIHTCRLSGFDGAVVASAVWEASDPVLAFKNLIQKW